MSGLKTGPGHPFETFAALDTRLDSVESGRAFKDIREFVDGIDLTGSTDNSTLVQTAIDAAVAADYGIWIPSGTLKVGGVTLRSGLHIKGAAGMTTRLILPDFAFVGGIFGTGTAGVSADDLLFEDLVLDGQQQSRSVSCGNALLKAYMAARWTLRRLIIKNGTSYGFGYQGYPGEPDVNKRGPETDLVMEQVYLSDNGYIGGTLGTSHSGTPNSSDNVDIKSSERILLMNCYATGASDKGFNPRARFATYINCVAENNVIGWDLNSHRRGPGALSSGPDNDSYHCMVGGGAKGNIGSGIAVTATTGESDTHADLIGVTSMGNGGSGLANNAPAVGSQIRISVQGGKYVDNTAYGMALNAVEQLSVDAIVRGNTIDGILLTDQAAATIRGDIRSNTGWGVRSTGTSARIKVFATVESNTAGQISLSGAGNNKNAARDEANGQAGITAPSFRGWAAGTLTVTANRAYYMRFVPSRDMLVTSIAFMVFTVDAANPNVDVGIYDASGARLVSSGATAGKLNALGKQSVTITATLLRAHTVYYAALSTPSAAVAQLHGASGSGTNSVFYLYGSTMPTAEAMVETPAHPLPATATGIVAGGNPAGPILAVNE